jgi:serine/threonine protein kinase
MLHLRRRKAAALSGREVDLRLLNYGSSANSLENTPIGFAGIVMSLQYRPKASLNNLAQAERVFLFQGFSFRVEKTYIIDDIEQHPPQAVVIKRPVDTGETVSSNHHWNDLCLEVQALLHPPIANHRNIVDILAIGWEVGVLEDVWPVLVMPFAVYGTLDVFQSKDDIPDQLQFSISLDVACGLEVLHACGVIHGDLKSENVLLFWEEERIVAKLCDFGCSVLNPQNFGKLVGGSQPWNCPEWKDIMPNQNLPLTDIYCFGLLFWRTIAKVENPFQGLRSFANEVAPSTGKIEDLKRSNNDQLLEEIKDSLGLEKAVLSEKEKLIANILENSIRQRPRKRTLLVCLTSLRKLVELGHGTIMSYVVHNTL